MRHSLPDIHLPFLTGSQGELCSAAIDDLAVDDGMGHLGFEDVLRLKFSPNLVYIVAQEPLKLPPKEMIDILNAPATPRVGAEGSRFSTKAVHKVVEKWTSIFSNGLKAR